MDREQAEAGARHRSQPGVPSDQMPWPSAFFLALASAFSRARSYWASVFSRSSFRPRELGKGESPGSEYTARGRGLRRRGAGIRPAPQEIRKSRTRVVYGA